MATYYVNSNATGGTNTGATWANAFLSFWSLPALLSTDTVYVASTHVDSPSAGNKTLTCPAIGEPAYIFSVTAGTTTQAPGATVSTVASASLIVDGSFYIYGVTFICGLATNFSFYADTNESGTLVACTLRVAATGGVIFNGTSTISCTVDLILDTAAASRYILAVASAGADNQHIGLQIVNASNRTGTLSTLITAASPVGSGRVYFHGCDFSSVPSTCEIYEGAASALSIEIHNCRLPATWTMTRIAPTARYRVAMYNCGFGNADSANIADSVYSLFGAWNTTQSAYLNGADGAVSNNGSGVDVRYSWLTSASDGTANRGQLTVSDWLYAYVQPGTYTASIYIAGITAFELNPTAIYMEAEYMNSATNHKYTSAFTPGAGAPGGAQYPSGGTWTGASSAIGVMSLPGLVVAQAGLIRARVFITQNTDTFTVNPKLVIT
jgi:hypothetical protein